jgi:hypothetical protein
MRVLDQKKDRMNMITSGRISRMKIFYLAYPAACDHVHPVPYSHNNNLSQCTLTKENL